ncbi:hypothetical protein L249_5206 [Ophiocordyceps polyrhachis-furcata BCC 54312]|uniref:Vta1 C-terminal domain-containing protein n=1 Tax=Ophiocordyceps polyrhachis-furcata BCC 54312 TaxID=1330021 RepID=A0A367L8X6_9HYPO|nr:hypothetical protein L249_5206 [Ophiocordyceps polyrhachis-furcata BCC 54312]
MEPLPAGLKIPEVSRFINRANQLRSIKPALAYWCEYHAVNQIVGRSLHTTDDACFAFTKTLIESLEAVKAERADDDAIVDNDAGQAYVEQFANETFARAERALRADKVTRQTADTFDAAATFFDLTREWGTPDAETLQKIKFAKWNAARILKAIREGKDPNESNPAKQPSADQQVQLSPDDPSVRQIISPPPPAAVDGDEPAVAVDHEHSAAEAPPRDEGGYFPPVPSDAAVPAAGQGPVSFAPSDPMSTSPPTTQTDNPQFPPGPSAPPPQFMPSSPSFRAVATSPPAFSPPPQATSSVAPRASMTSQRDINDAQKHAKWAISALNFDDVPTAVKELRNALQKLGSPLP